MKRFQKWFDRFAYVLVLAAFTLVVSVALVGLIVNEAVILQVAEYEAILDQGTKQQIRTVYVFDQGAVYGYKKAMLELQPRYERLIHEAIEHHDLMLKIKAAKQKKHKRGK